MTYILDNNISPRLAKMLAALDVNVAALRDHFPPDTKDLTFLEKFKEMDIVFISADTSIRTRPAEARLLKEAGKTSLFFGPFWGKMKIWPQAEWLIKRWPMIHGVATGVVKGTCAEIKQNGRSQIFRL